MTDYQTKLAAARATSEAILVAQANARDAEELIRLNATRAIREAWDVVDAARDADTVAWKEASLALELEKAAILKGQKP